MMRISSRALRLWLLTMAAFYSLASSVSAAPCEVPDNGSGTADLPPAGCEYEGDSSGGSNDKYVITDGLPPGTTIEMVPIHKDFICNSDFSFSCAVPLPPGTCEGPGGVFGGNAVCADSVVELQVTGTGALAGYNRTLVVPIKWEAHSGPRNPGDPVQSFPTEMIQLEGQLFGDPDFDIFRILGGSAFGLPSLGSTTLTRLGPPGSNFSVDSFFDIAYQIDFVGAPGSVLEGMSGITVGSLRILTGNPPAPPAAAPALGLAGIAMLLSVLGGTAYWRLRGSASAA